MCRPSEQKLIIVPWLSIDSIRPYQPHARLNQATNRCVKSSYLKMTHTDSCLFCLLVCAKRHWNLQWCFHIAATMQSSNPERAYFGASTCCILIRSCKHTSCHVKMRLYKVIGTQPFPLLYLAETLGSWRGWCLCGGGSRTEKSVRAALKACEKRLMEHLTQSRSQFELSHTLMTQLGACHHGCLTTQ